MLHPQSQITFVQGPPGSGKSHLIKAIVGAFMSPSSLFLTLLKRCHTHNIQGQAPVRVMPPNALNKSTRESDTHSFLLAGGMPSVSNQFVSLDG